MWSLVRRIGHVLDVYETPGSDVKMRCPTAQPRRHPDFPQDERRADVRVDDLFDGIVDSPCAVVGDARR